MKVNDNKIYNLLVVYGVEKGQETPIEWIVNGNSLIGYQECPQFSTIAFDVKTEIEHRQF